MDVPLNTVRGQITAARQRLNAATAPVAIQIARDLGLIPPGAPAFTARF